MTQFLDNGLAGGQPAPVVVHHEDASDRRAFRSSMSAHLDLAKLTERKPDVNGFVTDCKIWRFSP
jgi:hypothetical protein